MKKQSVELVVEPLTVVYIALSLVLGRFSFVIGLFALTIFHEFFHCFAATIFKIPVDSIHITPIGCHANIAKLERATRLKQCIVLIVGPLSYFFSWALIKWCFNLDIISIYRYEELCQTNLLIMLFNLLPIYPLDGGRIGKIVLSSLFDELTALRINGVFNVILGTFLGIYLFTIGQYVFATYLIILGIKNVWKIKKKYQTFIGERLIYGNKATKKRLNVRPIIYRYAQNFYLTRQGIISERQFISKIINKKII